MNIRTLAIALVLLGCAADSLAATPLVDARQQRQHARIHQGVASGELTARETTRLARQQAHIRRVERRAKADGVVTPGERVRLAHEQNQASRRIYRQKHDGQHH